MMRLKQSPSLVAFLTAVLGVLATVHGAHASGPAVPAPMPRYDHIFVIIAENRNFDQISGSANASNINRLAKTYGLASQFFAERHPSEPNYIAMLGGDTFGISDDDAFYCKPNMPDWGCEHSANPGYVDHTVTARNLTDQLSERGLAWKGYFEDIPEPGSQVFRWPSRKQPDAAKPDSLYAVKHNGFMAFKSVQDDPRRGERIVGFSALDEDIAAGTLPAFAVIVPNQCNDMHGLTGSHVPPDCDKTNASALVARGDRVIASIVAKLTQSSLWASKKNAAIVITFDENDSHHSGTQPVGCCGSGSADPNNPGGGRIATIVMTNHGVRGITDSTPYNHYSLLRTVEQAFGIDEFLGHAADENKGVVSMLKLFATAAHN